jgi:DNA-binding transcriptional MerR regulator
MLVKLCTLRSVDAGPEELTIDEFAQRIGLPSSTIRLYRTKGLLPAPQKRGRGAFFGPGHVARVELIGRLQERGFSLAAIAELVQQWENGRSLEEILGLERRIPTTAPPSPQLRITPTQLAARFPSIDLTADVMAQVLAMGLVEFDDDGMVVIANPAYLEVGAALVDLGFPVAEVLDEAALLRAEMTQVAERFAALFERHVWRSFTNAGKPGDGLPRVNHVLEQLGPLAERVVLTAFRAALADTADQFLATEAARETVSRDRVTTKGR